MPYQEQLDDFLETLITAGRPAKNPALREALGWDEALYEEVKAELIKKGIVVRGRGRSDSVSLVGAEPAVKAAAPAGNARKPKASGNGTAKDKSLESWIWDAACSIRGAKDAPKYKDYILPLIFTKRLCDVFDDELNRIAAEVGSRQKAFQLVAADHKLVRFYLPLVPGDPEQPVWSVIRKLSDKIGEGVTTQMRAIARENPLLQGIIDRVDFNATTHGQRDLAQKIDPDLDAVCEALATIEDGTSKEPIARCFCLITAADGQIVAGEEVVLARLLQALGQEALLEELPELSKRFRKEDGTVDVALIAIGDAATSAGAKVGEALNWASQLLSKSKPSEPAPPEVAFEESVEEKKSKMILAGMEMLTQRFAAGELSAEDYAKQLAALSEQLKS